MRKIILYNVISLDGYHTGMGNDPSVMFPMMGEVFNTYNTELLRGADVQLMGRVSFELFQSFWPKVADNPDAYSDSERELSLAGKSVKGVVVSDMLEGNWQGLRIIRRRDAHQQIAELKRQAGKDILITGSRTLWNDLLALDLVDEIHLLIGNRILGQGVPAFAGIQNTSIHNALVDLLGKPITEASALCIPTGVYPFPGGPAMAYQFISGLTANPMCELGWKSLGVLELTALPSIEKEVWIAAVEAADALLVQGGDVFYLFRWMRESGLADRLLLLRETVYVGVSAGSMVTAPIFGETYDDPNSPFVITERLGLVDFALLPHVDHPDHPESTTARVERMAAEVPVPTYAIDDQTAIKVVNGMVDVVSEGHWKRFAR